MGKKRGRHTNAKSDDTITKLKRETSPKDSLFDDPTCIDAASQAADADEDDEVIDIEWALQPPTLEVVGELVKCRKRKSWVNLIIQYEAWDDEEFEYEFDIVEVDSS